MKKSLAIVVLTWNDFENTKNCIKNIYPQLNNKTKLILVDNNSKKDIYDRTIDWIKKNYTKNYIKVKINSKLNFKKKIFLVRNKKNLGWRFKKNAL